MSGASVRAGDRICDMETHSSVSYRGELYPPAFLFAGVFCIVLELRENGGIDFAGTDGRGRACGMGIAIYEVRGKNVLFTIYVVLMLLPFQVTMLSSYLTLDRLSLLDTQWAVILPAVFSTFPIFIIYGGFRAIPKSLIEAARIDGAGEIYIFFMAGIGLGKGGILSALVLGFLEYWNMIEQPFAFLEDKTLWPLSLYLPEISWTQAGFAFAASVMMLIPAIFVFVMGQDYLEQGIIYSGLKG